MATGREHGLRVGKSELVTSDGVGSVSSVSSVSAESPATLRVLTLLDYASLAAGLELLPHRAQGIFAYFGLDETAGRAEVARWEKALAERPADRDELGRMRSRMTSHWVRWDRETPYSTGTSSATSGARASSGPVVPQPMPTPAPRPDAIKLSPLEYGSLMMGLELHPTKTAQVFDAFDLRTVRGRDAELTAWEARLAANPEEKSLVAKEKEKMRGFWERWGSSEPVAKAKAPAPPKFVPRKNYVRPRQLLSQRERDAMDAAAEAEKREAALSPSKRQVTPTTLPLLDYVALSFRLEGAATQLIPRIFADYGLEVATGEREVTAWKRKLARDPELRREYDELSARMAASREREELPPSSVRVQDVEITIQQYAELCVEFEHDPRNADALFQKLGLTTASARAGVDATWRIRLSASPEDTAAFERLRAETRAAKQNSRAASPTPLVGSGLESAPVELLEYALLCVEMDMTGQVSAVAQRLGLDATAVDRAHRYWQTRFATDTEARTQWVAQTNRLRRHWRLPPGRT